MAENHSIIKQWRKNFEKNGMMTLVLFMQQVNCEGDELFEDLKATLASYVMKQQSFTWIWTSNNSNIKI